jgi:hypothetical protein
MPGSAGVPPAPGRDSGAWRSRGHLPHFDLAGSVQMVNVRLADSLPFVHALIEVWDGYRLDDLIQSRTSFTARAANAILGRSGVFWQREYFDRTIRDSRHLNAAIDCVHRNPVAAGLVLEPQAWMFGSAWRLVRRAGGEPALPGKRPTARQACLRSHESGYGEPRVKNPSSGGMASRPRPAARMRLVRACGMLTSKNRGEKR